MHYKEHEDIRSKLELYSVGLLNDVDWVRVRTHLSECDRCRLQMTQPTLWNRAGPRQVRQENRGAASSVMPISPPGWSIVIGTALVAALVASGVGYAIGSSPML